MHGVDVGLPLTYEPWAVYTKIVAETSGCGSCTSAIQQ
jgi:hypothetical protein